MPARSDHDTLSSLLLSTQISKASSVEDLSDTEAAHKDALAAAKAEHQRVRESALRAYRNNELREAQAKLQKLHQQEVERLRLESEAAQAAARLIELQKKQIPIPRAPTPPPAPAPKPAPIIQKPINENNNASLALQNGSANLPPQRPVLEDKTAITETPAPRLQSHHEEQSAQKPTSTAAPAPPTVIEGNSSQLRPNPSQDSASARALPGAEEYRVVHQRLKELRKNIIEYAKRDPGLKKRMGEMRREVRKSVGQLTEGRGANKIPLNTITAVLKEALHNIPSPPIDPRMYLLSTPSPVEGAHNNGETLPALFIYLFNIFSKAVISQFADEAGVAPKTADPIGVIAVSTFAQAELCWRGSPLIDILICKFRVACPVVFGIRGNEKTEEGRKRLGWRRDGGEWVGDQAHYTRMTGLGAGYAAISLRDFSKSKLANPYPPWKYWQSMSVIVNTPPNETSSTQYVVLKAMIENYEQRFMNFYGSAARAALQVALVDFPGRAPENNVAVASLKVLGDKLRRDLGLHFRPFSGR